MILCNVRASGRGLPPPPSKVARRAHAVAAVTGDGSRCVGQEEEPPPRGSIQTDFVKLWDISSVKCHLFYILYLYWSYQVTHNFCFCFSFCFCYFLPFFFSLNFRGLNSTSPCREIWNQEQIKHPFYFSWPFLLFKCIADLDLNCHFFSHFMIYSKQRTSLSREKETLKKLILYVSLVNAMFKVWTSVFEGQVRVTTGANSFVLFQIYLKIKD